MSFFSNLLKSIGIKKEAQPVPQPTPTAAQPAPGIPFNSSRGNQQLDQARQQNLKNDMIAWLNQNLAYARDDVDLELALERDGRSDWIDSPLFFQTISEMQNAVPAGMASPQQVSNPYPDLSAEEIEQFVRNQGDQGLPPQITENPNNMALYESIVGQMSEQGDFGDEFWNEQQPEVAGISSEELADIFYNNYLNVSDDHENPEDSEAYNRFQQLTAKFPGMNFIDVLQSRVFRGVPGGYDPKGQSKQDFRIKFFIENASWLSSLGLLPQSVQQIIDGGQLNNSKGNYEQLYQDIDTISNTLASILAYDDPQVKDRVWDWVSSKLGSQAMKDQYEAHQNAVDDTGAEFQHSEDRRVNELRGEDPSTELNQDQRATIMDAYKGDLQAMGQTLRYLGSDIRKHILDEIAQKNPKFAPGGEWYSKTLASEFWPDQAANIIDSLVSSDAFSDPKKLKDLERKGKANFKIDEGGRVVMRPSQGNTWDSIDFSKMLPLDEKLNIWIDGMVNDSANVDPDSYQAGLRDINQLGNTKIDRTRLKTDPGYRKQVQEQLKKSKRLHAQMDQILSHIGEYLTSDEVTDKYPKNVIMAYLDLITTHKNIKEVGALMSENSERGQKARRQLALKKSKDGELGGYTPEMIEKMDDAGIKQISDGIIQQEIARRSNVSSKAQDYYRQLLDRDDSRTANLLRQIGIIKKAVSRVYGLRRLASSMSKFASVDYLMVMKQSIRDEMRQKLAQL